MKVKFSVQIENQFGYTWSEIKEIANATEKHGYHSFYTCDHFFLDSSEASEGRDTIEAWTMLTAIAMMTKEIKLGTLVTGNNYRNPALLAKIAASLDHISNGRMEFGIGAGWKEVEYEAYGYSFPSVSDRMEQLEETLQIVKSLWNDKRTTFEGKHYQIKDAVFAPKPVQDNPVILIGGGGEKKTLRFVAKYGDYMNLPFTPVDQLQRKLDALKGHCEDIGRDYEDVGKSYFGPVWIGDTEEEVENRFVEIAERSNQSLEQIKQRFIHPDYPGSWLGTPEQIKDRIEYMQTLGFDYFFLQQPFDRSPDMVDKFAEDVMKKYFR